MGAISGWMGTQYLIAAMQIEGIDMTITDLTEILFLKLKMMSLIGLIGVIIVIGVSVPKMMNLFYRSLIIIVPTLVVSTSVFYAKKWILLNPVDKNIISHPMHISVKAMGLEAMPFMGLATAFIITLSMIIISKRGQQQV